MSQSSLEKSTQYLSGEEYIVSGSCTSRRVQSAGQYIVSGNPTNESSLEKRTQYLVAVRVVECSLEKSQFTVPSNSTDCRDQSGEEYIVSGSCTSQKYIVSDNPTNEEYIVSDNPTNGRV
ncbi:hypothetical protein PFLG_02214 [Plasmodium falciparum RAJ116]|uniref:Uncharacterized protein n=1 Tax=Plasmodium falciparum RAJ116 TaxID=580058 RepID=A0A0L0CZC7_PLAFA|nr:hypothetical protein PFLG_02214 [Plasmodium falciparum RAJ116]